MGIKQIILESINLPHEVEWIEFKSNFWNPKEIGENMSALSNHAAIHEKKNGYLIQGIDDETHQIIGTNIDYQNEINNEPFQHFLARKLNPSINFQFYEHFFNDKRVVLLIIPVKKCSN